MENQVFVTKDGEEYRILSFDIINPSSNEEMVVYQSLKDGKKYTKPIAQLEQEIAEMKDEYSYSYTFNRRSQTWEEE